MDKEQNIATANQSVLITYAVLTGLTPLIPIPFVDDLAKTYFRKRMIRLLAKAHGLNLETGVVNSLSEEDSGGCLTGCVATVLLYPLKKIFRKIFFFLEWKRAVDLTSYTYHYGYLVDYVLRERLPEKHGNITTEEFRRAIEKACREAPIKPVETAVGATFRQSKAVVLSATRMLEQSLRNVQKKPDEEEVEREIAAVEEPEKEQVSRLVASLQNSLGNIPERHFSDLRENFKKNLGIADS